MSSSGKFIDTDDTKKERRPSDDIVRVCMLEVVAVVCRNSPPLGYATVIYSKDYRQKIGEVYGDITEPPLHGNVTI